MTEEKINKGKELLKRLHDLKEDKGMWERGVTLWSIAVSDKYDYIDSSSAYRVRRAYIDFEKLKEDTLANIDKMIEETQREFDNL